MQGRAAGCLLLQGPRGPPVVQRAPSARHRRPPHRARPPSGPLPPVDSFFAHPAALPPRPGLGAALIPPPRTHLVRYFGVFAPHSRLRTQLVPSATAKTADP